MEMGGTFKTYPQAPPTNEHPTADDILEAARVMWRAGKEYNRVYKDPKRYGEVESARMNFFEMQGRFGWLLESFMRDAGETVE